MDKLPVECISCILAFTSPKNVCILAGVSTSFRSAADSDLLWRTFLPPEYREIISHSPSSSSLNSLSEKALYFHLSDRPVLMGTRNSTIALIKESGDKCYMISSMDIETTMRQPYCLWRFIPQSRFSEVAYLKFQTLIRMRGKIEAKNLSRKTYYGAYFVFNFKHARKERLFIYFSLKPILSQLYIHEKKEMIVLDALKCFGSKREDGWMEIEMGQFFNQGDDDDASIFFTILPTGSINKLLFEGVEFRPVESV